MPDSDQPRPPGFPSDSDELSTIRQFKHAPVRVGCFGCMVSGWGLVVALIALILLAYLAVAFFRS
jgi:hypothetical protein